MKCASLLILSLVLHTSNSFAAEKFQTIQLNDMTYEEMKTLVRKETGKCYSEANQAEVANASSIEDADQFVGEEQSPELVSCLTNVSGLILSRRDQNDKTVQDLFQKSLLEINQDHRKTAYRNIIESAVTEYKLLRQKMRDASSTLKKVVVADLATAYEKILNTLSEIKPRLSKEKEATKPLFELVAKSELTPDIELRKFRAGRGGSYTVDLSKRAQEILAAAD